MVLAIPFFPSEHSPAPVFIAYIPVAQVRRNANDPEWFSCFPAYFEGGMPHARRDYKRFCDAAGVALLELPEWSAMRVDELGGI